MGTRDCADEEAPGRTGIASSGQVDVDDLAELVDGSVQVTPHAPDLDLGLVGQPAITDGVATWTRRLHQQRSEPLHPPVDGHVVDLDATLGQQLLDISVGQAEPQIPTHSQDDDVWRKAEAGEG